MARLAPNPAYLMIEDQLDAIGQKYRVQRIIRGFLLCVAVVAVLSFAAVLVAHRLGTLTAGQSKWITVDLAAWVAGVVTSILWFIVRPLVLRPRALDVARLVEARIPGLHNGLTNSLLLADRDDLANSPWLPVIFQEILGSTQAKPMGSAVKFTDLRPLVFRLLLVVGPLLVLCCIPPFPGMIGHGWKQLMNPSTFVPRVGAVQSVEVQPGDITLVAGQSLEITVIAKGSSLATAPEAKLIFDNDSIKGAQLTPAQTTEPGAATTDPPLQVLRYSYRVNEVHQPVKYRLEVAGTQTPWFEVKMVRQVKLEGVLLEIVPPGYTGLPRQTLSLKGDDLEKTPLIVPQGSLVQLAMTVDVPVKAGMLLVNDTAPQPLTASQGNRRFGGMLIVNDDLQVSLLLTEGAGQIIARLPANPLVIHCTKDAPPSLEMRWPTQDVSVAPDAELKISAIAKDDYGLGSAVVQVSTGGADQENFQTVYTQDFPSRTRLADIQDTLDIKPELRKHGTSIKVRLTVTDNRNLGAAAPPGALLSGVAGNKSQSDTGPQTVTSSSYQITFRDPAEIAKEEKEKTDKLREKLMEMLKLQNGLNAKAVAFKPAGEGKTLMAAISSGQVTLRTMMQVTSQSAEFDAQTLVIRKTLMVLAAGPAKEAVDFAANILSEPIAKEQLKLSADLQSRQRRIISTLESLLAILNHSPEPATKPADKESGHIPTKKEELDKLNEALKEFIKEEQRILDQTASLAKKPVDNFTDADKKLLEELKMAQEKMDAFMEQKLSDFSKNAEQDMSNAALLKDLMSVYSEVTMAKDALNKQATEVAVAAEEMGLENAKEISSNLEKWLPNSPDRTKWSMEDPIGKNDTPMPELPKELEDMIGDLLEKQEDLFDGMEDANSNWTDSMDKGVGWDATDGPIADMSAKGVTGNTLPNDNEMAGRSGEGRSGKSQGEFVGDTAKGKGGRNTPTRLDPTPFAAGQIKDDSKDPTGGATGGGKLSGQGGQGLEGPVGPKQKQEMQRLAEKQAQLRNNAERLQLQYKVSKYDNFKLMEAIGMMRRVESDLGANRYQMAMRRRDVLLDQLDTSRLLTAGQVHTKYDTTPTGNTKLETQINDAMKGELPAAWSEALKEYYKKLAQE